MNVLIKLMVIYSCISILYVHGIDYCPLTCDRMGVIYENTGCKCTDSCPSNAKHFEFSQSEKDFITDLHNEHREKVASGSTNLPAGTNIKALAYDDNLAYLAMCWNKQCQFGHDKCRRTPDYTGGQNMFANQKSCEGNDASEGAVEAWYAEINQASTDCLNSYSGCAGHFTQMVWAETTHIGCAKVNYADKCQMACNYGPAGNMLQDPVYKQEAFSCKKDGKYTHLCEGAVPYSGSDGNTAWMLGVLLMSMLPFLYS